MSRYQMAGLAGVSLALALAFPVNVAASEADVAAIEKVRDAEVAGITTGDPDASLEVNAKDLVFMPPNEPATHGNESARTWLAGALEQFDLDLKYTSAEVTVAGDWAYETYAGVATFKPKAGGDGFTENIKGIHIYHRGADGTWKISHDIWNTDAPPPPME